MSQEWKASGAGDKVACAGLAGGRPGWPSRASEVSNSEKELTLSLGEMRSHCGVFRRGMTRLLCAFTRRKSWLLHRRSKRRSAGTLSSGETGGDSKKLMDLGRD